MQVGAEGWIRWKVTQLLGNACTNSNGGTTHARKQTPGMGANGAIVGR